MVGLVLRQAVWGKADMAVTVTRQPLKDVLVCLICNRPGPGLDLDHVVNRGMGGSKERDIPENIVPLCRSCHEAKTQGSWITWIADGRYHWQAKGSDFLQSRPVMVDPKRGCLVEAPEPPQDKRERAVKADPDTSPIPFEQVVSDAWETWVRQGETLAHTIDTLPWVVGDWVVAGEDSFGERASQHFQDLAMAPERMSNYAWVARVFPPSSRVEGLRWSHFRAVAALPEPERATWLEKAKVEGMTVRALTALVAEKEPKETHQCPDCGRLHVIQS